MANKEKIDDLFKSELGNYTETPPPAVWDALEKKLGQVPSRKPRGPFTWLGYFAMVGILVAISVLVARNITGNNGTGINEVATNSNNSNKEKATQATGDNNPNANGIGNTIATPGNNDQNSSNNADKITGDKPGNDDEKTAATQTTNEKTGKQSRINNTNKKTQNKQQIAANNSKHNNYSSAKQKTKTTPGGKGSETEQEAEQPMNEYSSSSTTTDNALEDKTTKKDQSSEIRSTDSIKTKKQPEAKPKKPKFNRFEAGIKGGYELGFDNDAAKKAVIAPYLQYKITRKLAIMLQPAVKYATVSSRPIGDTRSYYEVNNDGATTQQTDKAVVHVVGTPDSFWIWNYKYTQTHDSIVKSNVTGGTYVEFELPVLAKYYIAKDFSVYGGVNIIYSKLTGVTEHTNITRKIERSASETVWGPVNGAPPALPEPLSVTYTGTPISAYSGPQYPAPQGSLLRFGYMLGFSYEYDKKWLFDALVQQGNVKSNMQGGYNTNTPLSAPYIRLTVGYKLIK